ncbi:MAG: serine/threonine protein kinase, partial [Ktedonobacteraceae bacterium]|nr:serine/threonine protein kinase [Ktedonobacteraceae bacterium]
MIERDPLLGQHLGAYQIQHKLGEGGMARVYKAYHARLRRDVAIKVILAHIAGHRDFRVRFEREAQLIASLEHPNIVAVYDFGEEGAITYLVMQYVGGGTLRNQLQDGHPLAPQQAAHYTLQMARALHSAHQRGIVHRDVKPQNMLVSTHNRDHLLLSDFGIAKLFDGSLDNTWTDTAAENISYNSGQTSADQILGTLEYMAPEQINRKNVDARTDVYALGIVLFQMLTGRVPFLSTTTTGLMYQHVHMPPPRVREFNPAAPEVLEQIAARALEKAPEARFQSAEALALAVESAINGRGSGLNIYESGTHELGTHGLEAHGLINHSPTSIGGGYSRQPLEYGEEMGTAPGMHSYRPPSTSGSAYGQSFYPSGPHSVQEQNTGSTRSEGHSNRTTTAGGRQSISPISTGKHARKAVSMQVIGGIIMVVVALALLVMRFQSFTGGNGTPQSTGTVSA